MNKDKNQISYFWLFVKFIAKHIPSEFFQLFVFSIISGCVTAASVRVWEYLFNVSTSVTNPDFTPKIFILPLIYLLVWMLSQYLVGIFQTHKMARTEENVRIKLMAKLYDDINKIPADQFNNGVLYDRIQRIQNFLGGNRFTVLIKKVFQILKSLTTCVSITIMLISYHYSLVFLCVLSILPPTIFRIIRGKRYYYLAKFQTSDRRKLGYYFSLLTSRDSLKELRIYDACSYIEEKRKEVQNKLHKEESDFLRKNGWIQFFVDITRTLGVGVGIVITGWLVIIGKVSIGVFTSSIAAFQNLQHAFSTILISFGLIDTDLREFKEYIEFKNMLPETIEHKYTDELKFKDKITFKDVSYCYPNQNTTAIKNINIEINKGECVAIFGLNGSGKSTFIKLLLGLYSPTQGEVMFDNVPLKDYEPALIWQDLSAVFQEFVKYKFRIRDNIAFGNISKADDNELIEKVLSVSGMDKYISTLENGLDTKLGTEFGGVDLSGGQWQRITIARAMMKDASIVVLDEPTSAIDPLEEYGILNKFKELTNGKTAIIISHRTSLSRIADKILVFDEGEIVENGTHEELMDLKGKYYDLYVKQSKLYV